MMFLRTDGYPTIPFRFSENSHRCNVTVDFPSTDNAPFDELNRAVSFNSISSQSLTDTRDPLHEQTSDWRCVMLVTCCGAADVMMSERAQETKEIVEERPAREMMVPV
jgi:hypothetical protein